MRKDRAVTEVSQFVVEGIQIGQQVVAMAGPEFLRELARELGETGLRPEAMLRNGRMVFLTAPNCLSSLLKPDEALHRGPLRPNAPLLRWVSDWSWAYADNLDGSRVQEYLRRVHDFIRSLDALSLCTIRCTELSRNSLLALLADHRRVLRGSERPLRTVAAAASGRSS
jgi:hypothetical protein